MSADYLQFLQSKAKEANAVFFVFERHYASNSNRVYAFFEGKDDIDFFRPVLVGVEEISRRGLCVKVCKGKSSVLAVRKLIRDKYKDKPNDIYIIDKDFDDFLNIKFDLNSDVFVTCEYSVENYICNRKSIKYFIEKYIGIFDEDPIFNELIDLFNTQLLNFKKIIFPIVIFSLAHYEIFGNRPNFQNSDIGKYLSISSEGIVYRRNTKWIRSYLSDIGIDFPKFNRNDVKNLISRARKYGLQNLIRGKYLMWFFVKFMQFCCEYSRGKTSSSGLKIKPNVQISSSTVCQLIDANLVLPERFYKFLDGRIASFN